IRRVVPGRPSVHGAAIRHGRVPEGVGGRGARTRARNRDRSRRDTPAGGGRRGPRDRREQAMVAKLRAKPDGDRIPVTMGDFADFSLDTRFRLIYVAFNTFFGLLTQEDQISSL